jgi:valyl-tRNA synthetase
MSKSLGNSPDPLDLISKYGADGLRFGIVSIAPQGQDIRFQEDRIELGKNFCNKLWNASRFRQMSGPSEDNSSLESILARLTYVQCDADDHAILHRLIETTSQLEKSFHEFEFSAAAQTLYGFFWNDFCDWYVEVSKSKLQDPLTKTNCLAIQDLVLRQKLLLLHPFIPFITEELWSLLGYAKSGSFLTRDARIESAAALKTILSTHKLSPDLNQASKVELIKTFTSQARALKSEHNLASRKDVRFFVSTSIEHWALIETNLAKLLRMAGASEITYKDVVEGSPAVVTALGTLYLDLASTVDPAAEKIRLSKELDKLTAHINATETRLSNSTFVDKAPPAVIEGARKQLADQKAKRLELERLLKSLG